jgi:hypothetical protein
VRATLLICASLLLSCLACPASVTAIGPAPTLTMVLSPSHFNVVSNATEPLPMFFEGTATVQMGILDRNTYRLSLSSITDTGWVSTVSPTELTFSDSGSQDFDCTVLIPPSSPNMTANITVDGILSGGGFSISGTTTARVIVEAAPGGHGQPPTINRTDPSDNMSTYVAIGVVMAVAGAASLAYLRFFRKRKAS